MRRGNDGLAIENVGLVFGHEVGSRAFEALHVIGAGPGKHAAVVHEVLARATEFPLVIGGVVIVWRYHHRNTGPLGCLEEAQQIRDRIVLCHAFAHGPPGNAFRAQEIDLGVDDHQRHALWIELHALARHAIAGRLGVRTGWRSPPARGISASGFGIACTAQRHGTQCGNRRNGFGIMPQKLAASLVNGVIFVVIAHGFQM